MIVLLWVLGGACLAAAGALLALRSRRRETLLPVADAGSFATITKRTWLVWACLAGPLVALALALVLEARTRPARAAILPAGADAVIVIDLSGSTRPSSRKIANALLGLTRDGMRKLGLVVFSDTAYEALPPSTPAEGLKGWLDLFAHDAPKDYPWTPSFSKGTRISSGLVMARRMLDRDHLADGHVVLVSDLVDAPDDLVSLQSAVAQYQQDGIDLRVVSVPADTNRGTLPGFLRQPNAGFLERAATRTIDPARMPHTGSHPTVLLTLVAVLGLLAATYELALHPLTWRTQP